MSSFASPFWFCARCWCLCSLCPISSSLLPYHHCADFLDTPFSISYSQVPLLLYGMHWMHLLWFCYLHGLLYLTGSCLHCVQAVLPNNTKTDTFSCLQMKFPWILNYFYSRKVSVYGIVWLINKINKNSFFCKSNKKCMKKNTCGLVTTIIVFFFYAYNKQK